MSQVPMFQFRPMGGRKGWALSLVAVLLIALVGIAKPQAAQAHCQVPCGIYDDHARIVMMAEHMTTMEKAMTEINRLSQESPANYNQIVRWVNTKDKHADDFTNLVTYYFMAQRVKLPDPNDEAATDAYLDQLSLLHHMMFYAMKAKQTTDLEHIESMRTVHKAFAEKYFGKTAPALDHHHHQGDNPPCDKADCKKANCKKADCPKSDCKKADCQKAPCPHGDKACPHHDKSKPCPQKCPHENDGAAEKAS